MAGVVATALAAAACGDDDDADAAIDPADQDNLDTESLPALPTDLPAELFALGVASGDPLPDSVILWTRIVADAMADDGGVGTAAIPVGWEVATDQDFADVVASGDAVAEPVLAHCVHVDASALEPDTWYWYRFTVGDQVSPVGRTRTTPSRGADPDSLRFAFASCQNRQDGYWTAHEHLADEDVDLVLFLGDYIYEDEPDDDTLRPYTSDVPVDLAGYRKRWGEYKTDPALQQAHTRFPWVCTWDDHEVEDNYADDVADGAEPDDDEARDEFRQRRAAAYQVFYEHTPLRLDPPDGADYPIYREVGWGTLARFFMLDGRQYRSDQACGDTVVIADAGPACDEADDDSRTMLGEDQEAWLGDALADSEARWNVLAQQTVLSPVPLAAGIVNHDQWDGYPAARRRLLDQLGEVSNPVVITGDIHLSAVATVPEDPDDPSSDPLVTELVGTSISSTFPVPELVTSLADTLENVHYVEAERRGYVVCEVTPDELRADFRYVTTALESEASIETGASWVVADGNPEPRPA